jgi:hypothetical protein
MRARVLPHEDSQQLSPMGGAWAEDSALQATNPRLTSTSGTRNVPRLRRGRAINLGHSSIVFLQYHTFEGGVNNVRSYVQ